ncbi:DUF4019 domain-containing protein [Flammeovirgaceae bacterium SG7u.111]|nr:DUF4019 domain-containing protein [Flammeovirgaceae bacterium SG7u.132]WPO37666.1 DUF4019 domain-containing protein [Flammeovirgaceae bacterium SG7u.111]
MKKLLTILTCSLIITSCSFNQKEVIILKTLDQFDTQEENEQLGIDLLNYRFPVFMQQKFPDFTQDIYSNITYQYFIQDNNKQVSFRLILSNDALKYKDKIVNYFEETVDNQVERQVADKELFDNATKITLEHFDQLDKHDFDGFWDNTSDILGEMTTKDAFFESIKGRESISTIGGKRTFYCKQYYENMPGVDKTGFYVICFTFENDKNMIEQLTYHKDENGLKIIGYDYRMPN